MLAQQSQLHMHNILQRRFEVPDLFHVTEIMQTRFLMLLLLLLFPITPGNITATRNAVKTRVCMNQGRACLLKQRKLALCGEGGQVPISARLQL